MFLLDTNVISELRLERRADANVVAWAARTDPDQSFLSVVTILEIEIGALRLERRDQAQGRRLRRWIDHDVLPQFHDRILPIGLEIARRCAALHVPDPRGERDALIGATALVHNFVVVTRNTADFAPMGVALLNPWER